ncbi:MAG: hypothetical protein IJX28_05070 [Clostridia bacterium]|nr:hypothetical protein [Clostridia bacterium]
MKKRIILVAVLLCLAVFAVSCTDNNGEGSNTTEGPGINWGDLTGEGTGDATTGSVATMNLVTDDGEGWTTMAPIQ